MLYLCIPMGTMDSYKVDLRGMTSDVVSHHWVLADDFFSAVQGLDIVNGHVDATLRVTRKSEGFDLDFRFEGTVQVECIRCSELMDWPIQAHCNVAARLGDEDGDDGEVLTVAEYPGVADLSWQMYSLLALEIPIRHAHPDGECNPQVMAMLSTVPDDNRPADPRWAALQQLKTKSNNQE